MRVLRSSASLAALAQRAGLKIASNMMHGCPAEKGQRSRIGEVGLTFVCSVASVAEDKREMAVGGGNRRVVTNVDE